MGCIFSGGNLPDCDIVLQQGGGEKFYKSQIIDFYDKLRSSILGPLNFVPFHKNFKLGRVSVTSDQKIQKSQKIIFDATARLNVKNRAFFVVQISSKM